MAVVRKLKKFWKERFPLPDKVDLREDDGVIGVVTLEALHAVWTPCNART